MLTVEEALGVWGQEVCGNALYLPLNFAKNLKLLKKKPKQQKQKSIFKKPSSEKNLENNKQHVHPIQFYQILANSPWFLKNLFLNELFQIVDLKKIPHMKDKKQNRYYWYQEWVTGR